MGRGEGGGRGGAGGWYVLGGQGMRQSMWMVMYCMSVCQSVSLYVGMHTYAG